MMAMHMEGPDNKIMQCFRLDVIDRPQHPACVIDYTSGAWVALSLPNQIDSSDCLPALAYFRFMCRSDFAPSMLQDQGDSQQSSAREQQLPSTKAIVFSQFWMHLQLIAAHLMRNGVEFALLKRDLQHRVKQDAIAKFQVPS